MNLSKFFIDRPIFAGVISVLTFVAGLLALRAMPISEYPEVVPPSVVVRAQYPGANPKVIAETVATPIEEQINGVEGMLYLSSQATTDGLMTLTVTFRLGTDPDKAQQLVQNRVSQAEARLPEEVRRLGITTVKSSPDLTMVVDGGDKAVYREVTLGPWTEGLRVVTHGLEPGERIIVNGLQRVRPGSLVAPETVPMVEARTASAASDTVSR